MKKSLLPAVLLLVSSFSFAQLTLTCDTVVQTSTCAGGNVIVPFTVSGGTFNFGNVFKAQLSNAFGSFANPVNIGQLPWFSSGIIFATIPANTNFGFFYRIRVISTNPADTSNASPNPIFITQVAQLNQIIATPHNYVCPGDTITLTAINFANSYSWSTGDTTMSIQITQPGIYSVTTTDPLTCQSTAYDTLYTSCTGITESELQHSINIFPNPADDHLTFQLKTSNPIDARITWYNMVGETLLQTRMKLSGEKNVDVSAFAPGLYFVRVESDGQAFVKKVVVK